MNISAKHSNGRRTFYNGTLDYKDAFEHVTYGH